MKQKFCNNHVRIDTTALENKYESTNRQSVFVFSYKYEHLRGRLKCIRILDFFYAAEKSIHKGINSCRNQMNTNLNTLTHKSKHLHSI